jgi:hypothetical protein
MTWSASTCAARPSCRPTIVGSRFFSGICARAGLFPECWLAPSRELARRIAHQRDAAYLTIDARLDASLDQWAKFRYPIQDQAEVLGGALRGLRAAA